MDKGIEILRLKNIEFYNGVIDRKARKKNWVVLLTELVLTIKLVKAFINTKEAIKEAK